jgi:hypothetical protein
MAADTGKESAAIAGAIDFKEIDAGAAKQGGDCAC